MTFDFDQISNTGDLRADCQRYLSDVTTTISQAFSPLEPAQPLLRARSDALDQLMLHLWHEIMPGVNNAALMATGGYGRGELFPCSDIDLLFLVDDMSDTDCQQAVSLFVTTLWDIGLNVGHSVRDITECQHRAKGDITIVTNLMEARVIAGDTPLLKKLHEVTGKSLMWSSADFYLAKFREQAARHEKYGNTESNLEPNVKNSPGGLRDIQVIGWVALRHFGVALEDMRGAGFLNDDEQALLAGGRNFLAQIRFALHDLAGREEDRLLFDYQRKLAAIWGLEDGDKLAVEQFMQVYYRWAQAISQLNELLMQIFDHSILHGDAVEIPREVDASFEIRGNLLCARNDEIFCDQPSNLLRAFVVLANDSSIIGISAETWRLIRASRMRIDEDFRADPYNRKLFLQLMQSPHGVTKQLRRLNRHGLLGRYLPEFGQITGQMQFDLFHAYTVDAHTLEVLANTRRFFRADYTDKFPVSTRIAQRLRRPVLLYIAALYHDIGKGRGGDHSELGAVDARDFCTRHGLDASDTELVVWLVKNHLVMSSVSQRKDISDPDEIQRFATHVATEERLDYLYTLTVADIHGTNPDLWNAWRGSMLRQLYTETRRALRRGLQHPVGRKEVIDATRKASAELLEYRGFLEDELDEFWEMRGEDYFLRERPEDIAWHTEAIADHLDKDEPLVLVRQSVDSPIANATQIFVHAKNNPKLFARICAEIELMELSINDARIYLGTDDCTLDTFFVLNADGTAVAQDEQILEGIRLTLQNALEAGKDRIVKRRTPRQLKSFVLPTETNFTQDPDRGWTILEVATPDRPGLLARIGSVFVEHNIALQAAKIQTLGERVEDVFFITDDHGKAIADKLQLSALSGAIAEALDEGLRASA